MVRPCFLVIDREYSGSISTRKLVIETAKLNVITAYSAEEGLETLARFPNLNGVVMDAGMRDLPCCDLVTDLKKLAPGLPIIVITGPSRHECPGADHLLPTFDPTRLLELLKSLQPRDFASIEARNEELSESDN